MNYDYIATKPELDDELLAHYGIKGMKWRRRLKSKVSSMKTKFNRTINMVPANQATTDHGKKYATTTKKQYRKQYVDETLVNMHNKGKTVYKLVDSGKANHASGREGSRVNEGIAAGRKRAKKKKK